MGCIKTGTEERSERHKDQFLKLAEFDCVGIQSEHYLFAEIDNIDYCSNTNDTILNQIHLAHSFTTTGPSTGSSTVVEGSSYVSVWFALHRDYALDIRLKYLAFSTDPYPDTTTLLQIAAETFVENKIWPMSGTNINQRALSCFYEYSDNRHGFNIYHLVSSEFGEQDGKYLTMDKVSITKEDDFITYDVELSFNADLHIDPARNGSTNLWGEVRNGEMKAQFKIPK
ncbi:MAG: hypothetical protein ACJA1A_002994 [Saprospiraceae bacterium]|jgi:hypothetical protein